MMPWDWRYLEINLNSPPPYDLTTFILVLNSNSTMALNLRIVSKASNLFLKKINPIEYAVWVHKMHEIWKAIEWLYGQGPHTSVWASSKGCE